MILWVNLCNNTQYLVNQQMVSIKYQKIGELFCGPGGIGLGASLAKLEVGNANYKFDTQWATDILY